MAQVTLIELGIGTIVAYFFQSSHKDFLSSLRESYSLVIVCITDNLQSACSKISILYSNLAVE